MEDRRCREPLLRQLPHVPPPEGAPLAATVENLHPAADNRVAEVHERTIICRHRVVVVVAADYLRQPLALNRDWLMHAPPQLLLDGLQLHPHAVAARFPFNQEFAAQRFATDECEAEEAERLRLAKPASPAALVRMTSELDQPGLLRMQCQIELP